MNKLATSELSLGERMAGGNEIHHYEPDPSNLYARLMARASARRLGIEPNIFDRYSQPPTPEEIRTRGKDETLSHPSLSENFRKWMGASMPSPSHLDRSMPHRSSKETRARKETGSRRISAARALSNGVGITRRLFPLETR
jgi:hypothetical protein